MIVSIFEIRIKSSTLPINISKHKLYSNIDQIDGWNKIHVLFIYCANYALHITFDLHKTN